MVLRSDHDAKWSLNETRLMWGVQSVSDKPFNIQLQMGLSQSLLFFDLGDFRIMFSMFYEIVIHKEFYETFVH